jgi:acyl-CoA-binding protein
MSISEDVRKNFEFAVQEIRSGEAKSGDKISDSTKLKFYALYKQATVGKCTTSQPWAIQVVERAKWDAWNALGNMSQEMAMLKYCDLFLETTSV